MSGSFDEIVTLVRLVRAYVRGEYNDVPWESIALVVGALLYFVSPIDLIPDFVPVAGYVDDAAVIGFVIKSIGNDLREFRDWEDEQPADE